MTYNPSGKLFPFCFQHFPLLRPPSNTLSSDLENPIFGDFVFTAA